MADRIKVKIGPRTTDIAGLKKFFDDLPRQVRGKATVAMAEYMADELQKQDVSYPTYRYVSRRNAYGNYNGHDAKGWKSARQRAYVMARIREGTITPGRSRRTGAWARGWKVRGEGVRAVVYNDAPGVQWGHSEKYHAMQLAMVGWSPIEELTEQLLPDMLEYTADFIAAEIRRKFEKGV